MASIYDAIAGFAIFNGLSSAQLKEFIGNMPLDVKTYMPGERIVFAGEEVTFAKGIFMGEILVDHIELGGMIKVSEVWNAGCMIGMDRLFGIDPRYKYDVTARTKCGVFQLPKRLFIELLKSKEICMINYLNFLSLRAQRPYQALSLVTDQSYLSKIGSALLLLSDSRAESVQITFSMENNIPLFNLSDDEKRLVDEFCERGLLAVEKGKQVFVPCKKKFLVEVDNLCSQLVEQ